jgi:hypothetical protein
MGAKKIEAKWLRGESFRSVVETAWANDGVEISDGGILAKLVHMHAFLHAWDREYWESQRGGCVQHNES